MAHLDADQLTAGLDAIRAAPASAGTVEMIVRRPVVDGREVVEEGLLTADEGLVGDYWLARGSESTPGEAADPDRQLTVMGSRVVDLNSAAGGITPGAPRRCAKSSSSSLTSSFALFGWKSPLSLSISPRTSSHTARTA